MHENVRPPLSIVICHILQNTMSLVEPPPEACPGTGTEESGKVTLPKKYPKKYFLVQQVFQAAACAGCPNQAICASAGPAAPDPDVDLIAKNLDAVKNIVLVLSGKVKRPLYSG